MKKKRSIGVTILGIWLSLCAIPAFFAAIIGGISGSQAKNPQEVLLDIVMRILFIASPVVFIMAAIGLFKLKNWARLMIIFLSPILSSVPIYVLGLILNVTNPHLDPILNTLMLFGIVAVPFSIIYYLIRPKVKEQFKQP